MSVFAPLMTGESLLGLFKLARRGPWKTYGIGVQACIQKELSSGLVHVAFQCTRTPLDWLFNFMAFPNPKGRHFGLDWMAASAWKGIKKDAYRVMGDGYRLTLTGFSQGSAIAAYIAERFLADGCKVSLCRFASPRLYAKPSNRTKALYQHTTDVVVEGDPVTLFPVGWPQLGRRIELPTVGSDLASPGYHEPAIYEAGLNAYMVS